MPIEIKELVIRTHVGPAEEVSASPERSSPSEPGSALRGAGGLDTEQLVQECVRQVLRILAQQRER